jgi:hypothetical protein
VLASTAVLVNPMRLTRNHAKQPAETARQLTPASGRTVSLKNIGGTFSCASPRLPSTLPWAVQSSSSRYSPSGIARKPLSLQRSPERLAHGPIPSVRFSSFSGARNNDAFPWRTRAKFGGGVALRGGVEAGGLQGFAPTVKLAADR